jgi:hypothetical protein
MVWRHVVVGIGRKHLRKGKFNKDFGADTNDPVVARSCHGVPVASAIYARGIEEAPSHVESRRADYGVVGLEWHSLLGVVNEVGLASHTGQNQNTVDGGDGGRDTTTTAKLVYTEVEVQERVRAVLCRQQKKLKLEQGQQDQDRQQDQ